MGVIVEDVSTVDGPTAVALAAAVFTEPGFLIESQVKEEPGLVTRLLNTPQSIISNPTTVAEYNGGGGLPLMLVYYGWETSGHGNIEPSSLRGLALNAFSDRYSGHRLSHIFGEVAGVSRKEMAERSGCDVLNDHAAWTQSNNPHEDNRLFLVAIAKNAALASENQWMVRMFTYIPPLFCFRPISQAILLLARDGLTDQEISQSLGTTADAIKKRWGSIYSRVEEVLPGFLPNNPSGSRGAEKRRALLGHLREHPEELRPYSAPR